MFGLEFAPNLIEAGACFMGGLFMGGGIIMFIYTDGIKRHYEPNAYCHGWNDAKANRAKAYR